MLKIIIIIFLHLSFVICHLSLAQNIGDLALRRGVGVRAAGMGGAYTAVANDGGAVFYNPAGLAEPGLSYTSGNPDTEQNEVNGSFTLLKLGYLGYGSWSVKDAAGDQASVTTLAFGNRHNWLNWGLSYKSLDWTVAGATKEGFSSDIGFLARLTPHFNAGLAAQNILISKDTLAPAAARLGLAYKPLDGSLIIAADVEIKNTLQTFGHFGLEATVLKGLAIRGGVDQGEATAGVSLDLAIFAFDYAVRFPSGGKNVQMMEMGLKVLPQGARPFSIFKPKEYALIELGGAIKGGRDEFSFLGGLQPGLDSILEQIRKASKDPALDGLLLRLSGFDSGLLGMAVAQELRSELRRAKQRGKKIVCYLDYGATGDEYYLAAVADKIVAPPGAAVGGFGKSIAVYRLRGLYEKLGISWQVFHQGKYKNAFDPLSPNLTAEQKAMIQGLVADLYRQMITEIAADRGLKLEEIKALGDGDIFTPPQALALGLIDEIGYYQDTKKLAAQLSGDDKDEANIVKLPEVVPEETFFTRLFGVAVIEIDGELVAGAGGDNIILGGRYAGADTITDYVRKASDDIFVKAIILRINSPGGSAVAAGEIYKSLDYARKKEKVIIASIGNMGLSGGYYIAAAADKIVADPASLTGSIGVIGYLPMFAELLKKLEVTAEVFKEGKYADMFSGLRKLTPKELEIIDNLQDESYQEFIQAVAAGRKLPTAEVAAAAQGKIYTGAQARELKLVDELGGFAQAVDLAKKEGKIMGEPRLLFYHQPSVFFPFGAGLVESLGFRDLFWRPARLKYN